MEKVTISELKNRLSAYLKKVQAGQTVIVFDRDRPVARIEQVGGIADCDDRVARLERTGVVLRAKNPLPLDVLRTDAPVPSSTRARPTGTASPNSCPPWTFPSSATGMWWMAISSCPARP